MADEKSHEFALLDGDALYLELLQFLDRLGVEI
jgi:hypothetical protein